MVVVVVTNCPPQLRGDLTKWMIEVSTGVYVSNLNSRVREELWERIQANIKTGQATMVYSCNNEQGYAFLTHNTVWKPRNYEGIYLIKKLIEAKPDNDNNVVLKKGFSTASKYSHGQKKPSENNQYVVIDLETTGLDTRNDRIIEVGMLRVKDGEVVDSFQSFVKTEKAIPEEISKQTGITMDMLEAEGKSEEELCHLISKFIDKDMLVGYNIIFDIVFLEEMAKRNESEIDFYKYKDVMQMAKRKVKKIQNYQMKTVAQHLSIEGWENCHRALNDCYLTMEIYNKLNENK